VKTKIQILTKNFLDFMRGKTLKTVTVILQGFKRLDISICFIFSFIPQNCFDFGGAPYTSVSYTPENTVYHCPDFG
jgi:hypothetical protein